MLTLDGALQHVANIERRADLPDVHGLAFVDFDRVAGDDLEFGKTRKISDDVLGNAVGKPAGTLLAADIVERQDRN